MPKFDITKIPVRHILDGKVVTAQEVHDYYKNKKPSEGHKSKTDQKTN